MNIHYKQVNHKVLIHRSSIGGYWAEVPSMSGCFSQAETLPEMRRMIDSAIDEWGPGLLTIPQLPNNALIKPGLVRAIVNYCGINSDAAKDDGENFSHERKRCPRYCRGLSKLMALLPREMPEVIYAR